MPKLWRTSTNNINMTDKKTKAIVVLETPAKSQEVTSVESFISQAITEKLPVETMERLFALRTEYLAQEAKKQFDIAMTGFQGSCPIIKKTKSVENSYSYAPIDSIVKQVQEILKENNLSYSFKIVIMEKGVKAICIAKHISGHTESSEMEVPLGAKTRLMSDSQVTAAASTFAKRYAFCNLFGIMTSDEDTDGKTPGPDESTRKDNALNKLRTFISKANLAEVEDWSKKITKSDKYTIEQKADFADMVGARMKALNGEA